MPTFKIDLWVKKLSEYMCECCEFTVVIQYLNNRNGGIHILDR